MTCARGVQALLTTAYGRRSLAINVAMDDEIRFALSEQRGSFDSPSSIVPWLAATTGGAGACSLCYHCT